jgi:hypothetical protein
MSKTHDKTPELPGATKVVRAIKDLVYLGRSVRGRRYERIDGKLGAYEINRVEGEEFECDQEFAKRVCMNGSAVLVSGGAVEVTPQADSFPIYQSWIRDPAARAPIFECVELLKPMWFGDGCLLEKGSKVRLDISSTPRASLCYEDDQLQPEHTLRLFKLSPKKLRVSAAEQAAKVNAMYNKLFPAAA